MDMLTSYSDSEFAAEIWRKDQKSVFLFGILQFKANIQMPCIYSFFFFNRKRKSELLFFLIFLHTLYTPLLWYNKSKIIVN